MLAWEGSWESHTSNPRQSIFNIKEGTEGSTFRLQAFLSSSRVPLARSQIKSPSVAEVHLTIYFLPPQKATAYVQGALLHIAEGS